MAGLKIRVSEKVKRKLSDKHKVAVVEVEQAFYNRVGELAEDDREDNRTNPPTQWFISKTNRGRTLAVYFVLDGSNISIKSAFEPDEARVRLYKKICGSK